MPGFDEQSQAPPVGAAAPRPLIRVENVTKSFGDVTAVDRVSFSLDEGRILGFLGSDGAGKTTLLRMIATMIRPCAGRILINNLDAVMARDRVKPLIGYMPQRFGLYPDLSVEENIDFFMDIYAITAEEKVRRKQRYLRFSNLLPFLERPAGALSGGMKQKLGLACVLVHQPNILVLDEPTNGVDPVSRVEFWEILEEMRRSGMTILVSTAYMDEGERCDRLVLMHASRALEFATPEALRGNQSHLEQAVIERIEAVDRNLAEDRFGS